MFPVVGIKRASVAPIQPVLFGVVVMPAVARSRRAITPVPLASTPNAQAVRPVASVTHGESRVIPVGAGTANATTGCSTVALAGRAGHATFPMSAAATRAMISVVMTAVRRIVERDMRDTSPLTGARRT